MDSTHVSLMQFAKAATTVTGTFATGGAIAKQANQYLPNPGKNHTKQEWLTALTEAFDVEIVDGKIARDLAVTIVYAIDFAMTAQAMSREAGAR